VSNLKERKKKARERAVKGKILRRRAAARKKRKYEAEIERDVVKNREKIVPIINPDKEDARKHKMLEKNMEMLKVLEEEYKKEQEKRNKLNKDLEDKGCFTMEEKIKHIGNEATKEAGDNTLIEKTEKTLRRLHGVDLDPIE